MNNLTRALRAPLAALGAIRIRGKTTGALASAVGLAMLGMAGSAQAQTTFSNTSSITIPGSGTGSSSGSAASIYPSNIVVSGMTGTITKVVVKLNGLNHTFPSDVDMLLVGPNGEKYCLLSDTGSGTDWVAATITLDDAASALMGTSSNPTGTYKPTNYTTGDLFPTPAPTGFVNAATAGSATLASVFNGHAANGTWSLYISDDASGDSGTMTGGWSLTITVAGDPASTTSVASSANPSNPGDDVTFTSTTTVGGSPVTSGTITFKEGTTTLSGPTNVDANGQASFSINSLSSGSHNIDAVYSGVSGIAQGSTGTVTQVVRTPAVALVSSLNPSAPGDNVTLTATCTLNGVPVTSGTVTFLEGVNTLSGPTNVDANGQVAFSTNALSAGVHVITAAYSGQGTGSAVLTQVVNPFGTNYTPISIPSSGAASPYPSVIPITGMSGSIQKVTVLLRGLNHTFPDDLDILLVGPQGQKVMLMSDCGSGTDAVNADLTFDDAASAGLGDSTAVVTGTYKPTDFETGDTMAAPAPAGPYGVLLSAFNGTDPNGNWSLYVVDDASGDLGNIAGGWTITITANSEVASTTTIASSLNPSTSGQNVTITSTTLVGGNPASGGSVTFWEGVNVLSGPTPVDANGQASFSTSGLLDGSHVIKAMYSGVSGSIAASEASLTQTVNPEGGNLAPITIVDSSTPPTAANPYPSQINISGRTGLVTKVTVDVYGLGHTYPDDIDMVLVGPHGQKVMLMSDAGGGTDVTGLNFTFDDAAASTLPDETVLSSGTFKPTDYTTGDTMAAPCPAGPYGTSLGTFLGSDPNGTWSLYIVDDASIDSGLITGGWKLTITTGHAPVLDSIANQTIDELANLSVDANATDADNDTITYSLENAPAGMSIDSGTGVFTWTPDETQGPGTYQFDVVATDSTGLSGRQTVSVSVNEVNQPPSINNPGAQSASEGSAFQVQLSGFDADVPAQSLIFGKVSGPASLLVSPSGLVTWTPGETDGGTSPSVEVSLSDGVDTVTTTFTINVQETNENPVLDTPGNQNASEGTQLSVQLTGHDDDVPAQTLTYALVNGPSGMSVSPSGLLEWTPGESDGGTNPTVEISLTDGTATVSQTFTVTVAETNEPPVLTVGTSHSVNEGDALSFTATATDPDIPANNLTFSLVGAPAGMSINPTSGVVSWTPGEADGPNSYTFTVKVEDDGSPVLSDEEQVTVTVNEVNVLPTADDQSVSTDEDTATTITMVASDPDLPANTLTYSIVDGPAHGTLSAISGNQVTYTPSADYNGADSFTFKVNDGNGDSNVATVSITVNAINDAPVITIPAPLTTTTCQPLAITGVSVADVDAGTGQLTVELDKVHGKMTLASTAGLTFLLGDGTDDAQMVFNGDLASVNAALATVTYVSNTGYTGTERLHVHVSDNGNSGAGGPLTDLKELQITVTAPVEEEVLPSSYTATIGEDPDGALDALFASDDTYVSVFNNPESLTAELEFTGQASTGNGCELRFTLESSVDRGGLAQRIYLWNWDTSSWTVFNGSTGPTTDTAVTVTTTNMSYLANDGTVKAKVRWSPINDENPSQDGWQHRVDVAKWTLLR